MSYPTMSSTGQSVKKSMMSRNLWNIQANMVPSLLEAYAPRTATSSTTSQKAAERHA